MLLKIRVGRSDYYFFFWNNFRFAWSTFYKNRTGISTFSVCHVVSWLVAASFSLANSLISADVLSAARKRYKNTFSKVSFNINCNKNRLENWKHFSSRRISCKKPKPTIKKLRVGDLNLRAVSKRKHTYFLFGFSLVLKVGTFECIWHCCFRKSCWQVCPKKQNISKISGHQKLVLEKDVNNIGSKFIEMFRNWSLNVYCNRCLLLS